MKIDMVEMVRDTVRKLLSGRYYLVVVVGLVFAWCATHGKIEGKDVMIVTLLVFKDYFGRERSEARQPVAAASRGESE